MPHLNVPRRLLAAPLRIVAAASLSSCAVVTFAQTPPDAGTLLRESQQQPRPAPELPPVQAPKLLQDTGVKVVIKRFVVSGSTRFEAARFDALLADLTDRELGFAQLQAAADRVAALYREAGVHATAYLPEQDLKDGTLRIVVVEGRFGRLRIEADPQARALPLTLVERIVGRGQTHGAPLDAARLERATLVANDVPGVRVSSVLAAGEAPGETDVIVKVDARSQFSGAATLDNFDARATGATRLGFALAYAGLSDWGDVAQLTGNLTEGKQYARLAWDTALGASGWRGGVNASALHYELKGEFAASGGRGSATTFGALTTYPLLRGVERNLYASGGVEERHLINQSVAGNLSNKNTLALTAGVNGDATDTLLGGGALLGGVTLTAGRLDLGGNDADLAADQAGPRRDGRYLKLAANLGRLQRLSTNGSLWLSASGQVANVNLDSGEQFSIGGPQAVRAYPAIEGSGDNAWVATVEYRYHASDALQLAAFYDHGHVTRVNHPSAGAAEPNSYALKGLGVQAEWLVFQRLTLRAIVANRIGGNPAAGRNGDDSDGTRRTPRVYIQASVPF